MILPQLVVDGLVLHDSHPGHLLEDSLSAEGLQAVDLQLGVPEILEVLRRLVDLLTNEILLPGLMAQFITAEV